MKLFDNPFAEQGPVKPPTQKELTERKGVHKPTEEKKITGANKPLTQQQIQERLGSLKKTSDIKQDKPLTQYQLTNTIYNNRHFGLESRTAEYLKKPSVGGVQLPLNKWLVENDRLFRAEQRANAKGQTRSSIFQLSTKTSETKQEQKANRFDFDMTDRDWLLSRFVTPDKDLQEVDRINRYFTSTGWKFTSTRLGYGTAINTRPQFTRYADIKGNGRSYSNGWNFFEATTKRPVRSGRHTKGLGMGRYYSEAIDDNATTVYMEFGIPKFNNLATFLGRAVNPVDSFIANYGYVPMGYYAGKVVGGFIMLRAFPLTSIIIFIGKKIFGQFFGGAFNYYYMKPAMHTYWSTVSTIVTQLSTELGLFPPILDEYTNANDTNKATKMGVPVNIHREDIEALHTYFPDMVSKKTGYIDIYAVAMKSQKLANEFRKIEYKLYKSKELGNIDGSQGTPISPGIFKGYVTRSEYVNKVKENMDSIATKVDQYLSLDSFLTAVTGVTKNLVSEATGMLLPNQKHPNPLQQDNGNDTKSMYESNDDGTPKNVPFKENVTNAGGGATSTGGTDSNGNSLTAGQMSAKQATSGTDGKVTDFSTLYNTEDGSYKQSEEDHGYFREYAQAFDSMMRDGGSYAIFNVDFQGSVSDSVSNSVSDIDAGGMAKSVSQAARNIKFSTAGGNILPGMDAVKEQLVGVVTGALESATFGMSNVLMTLLGGGYIDMPKKWDDSSISLPTVNYSMTLISPYGHPIAQLQNIYIPLAMILAGSLPLAVGNASYTSPFLCSIFNKGVQNIRMGMITSVSITRGTSNLPYSRSKRCLAYEVSFTVTDFSNIMTAPINSSMFGEFFQTPLNDDTLFANYMATLASRDLYTEKYAWPKARLKMARLAMAVSQSTSANNHAMKMCSGFVKDVISPFVAGKSVANLNQSNNYI